MQAECQGLVCRKCGKSVPESMHVLSCPECGGAMRVTFTPESLRRVLAGGLPSPNGASLLRQWLPVLPIGDASLIERVSLGEVETPLLPSRSCGRALGMEQLYFKIEQGPTLSLKDRGSALCNLKALECGCTTVCVASSGNNAASVSAYGSRAGLRPVVIVQKNVSEAKIFKSMLYGATVVRIDGDMAGASAICNEMVRRHGWFQCGGPNPYRVCGKRTFAYGLVQQLGRAPDTLLIPCGGGAGLVAAYDGFRELLEAGCIDRMPRLVGVQLEACEPMTRAFKEGRDTADPVEKKPSLSDAIMNNNPCWGSVCLEAVRATGGMFISVSDDEFIAAIRRLGREEAIFAEPAGAVTTAALSHLLATPGFEDPGLTVCNVTGHGLNNPQVAADKSVFPPVVAADVSAVEAYLESGGR